MTETHRLQLVLLPGRYAVCRLPPEAGVPGWAAGDLVSVTHTADELSVVCHEDAVPAGVRREGGWRCLRVAGALDFGMVGVLASLLVPLAGAGVSVFCLSTFDTDYVMVREIDLGASIAALRSAGHEIAIDGGKVLPSAGVE